MITLGVLVKHSPSDSDESDTPPLHDLCSTLVKNNWCYGSTYSFCVEAIRLRPIGDAVITAAFLSSSSEESDDIWIGDELDIF